jgi:hypothetical protein
MEILCVHQSPPTLGENGGPLVPFTLGNRYLIKASYEGEI